jgi:tetratricopeptide (TPR) repeat protein
MLSERIGNVLLAAKTYTQLGKVATFMGRLAEAERWYQRALHYFEQTTPVNSHITNCLIGLVLIYLTQQKYAKAEPLLKYALSISEQRLGATHPSTQTIQTHYALLLQEMERTKKQGRRKKILGFFQGKK